MSGPFHNIKNQTKQTKVNKPTMTKKTHKPPKKTHTHTPKLKISYTRRLSIERAW